MRRSIVAGIATESHSPVVEMVSKVHAHAVLERCRAEAMIIRESIGSKCALDPQTIIRLAVMTRKIHFGADFPFSYTDRKQLTESTAREADRASMLVDTA